MYGPGKEKLLSGAFRIFDVICTVQKFVSEIQQVFSMFTVLIDSNAGIQKLLAEIQKILAKNKKIISE